MIDLYSIIFWGDCIILTVFLAKKKGRNVSIWLLVSLFLGVFAVIGILFARNLKNNKIFGLNRNDSIVASLLLISTLVLSIPTIQKIHKNYLAAIERKEKTDEVLKPLNTKLHLDIVRRRLEDYHKHNGFYPSTEEGLEVLLKNYSGGERKKGYLMNGGIHIGI